MTLPEGREFLNDLKDYLSGKTIQSQLILGVPFIHLGESQGVKESGIYLAAQNCSQYSSGAYTGEVSASMLKSIGVQTVILGHSERRAYFNETDESLAKKVDAALANDMKVIFCFGEELQDRKAGNEEAVVGSQISNALFHLDALAFKNI